MRVCCACPHIRHEIPRTCRRDLHTPMPDTGTRITHTHDAMATEEVVFSPVLSCASWSCGALWCARSTVTSCRSRSEARLVGAVALGQSAGRQLVRVHGRRGAGGRKKHARAVGGDDPFTGVAVVSIPRSLPFHAHAHCASSGQRVSWDPCVWGHATIAHWLASTKSGASEPPDGLLCVITSRGSVGAVRRRVRGRRRSGCALAGAGGEGTVLLAFTASCSRWRRPSRARRGEPTRRPRWRRSSTRS